MPGYSVIVLTPMFQIRLLLKHTQEPQEHWMAVKYSLYSNAARQISVCLKEQQVLLLLPSPSLPPLFFLPPLVLHQLHFPPFLPDQTSSPILHLKKEQQPGLSI